jgi:hypothetical protein
MERVAILGTGSIGRERASALTAPGGSGRLRAAPGEALQRRFR